MSFHLGYLADNKDRQLLILMRWLMKTTWKAVNFFAEVYLL